MDKIVTFGEIMMRWSPQGALRMGCYYFERAADLRRSLVVYDRNGSSFYSSATGIPKIPEEEILEILSR